MRHHSFKALILVILLVCSSCLEFEEEVSAIAYGLRDYHLSSVLQEDWGHHSANHYNMDFVFVGENAVFEYNKYENGSEAFEPDDEIDCYLFVELFSPGKTTFTEGVFHHIGNRTIEEIDNDEFVFRRVQFGRNESERIFAERGTITVRKNNSGVFRFQFDITMESDKNIKGLFLGTPAYLKRF